MLKIFLVIAAGFLLIATAMAVSRYLALWINRRRNPNIEFGWPKTEEADNKQGEEGRMTDR